MKVRNARTGFTFFHYFSEHNKRLSILNIFLFCFFFMLFFLCMHFNIYAFQANHLTQGDITWTFDGAYECGNFANGDYWVVGSVDITSITPNFEGGRNGCEINPISDGQQGYDDRAGSYQLSLVQNPPFSAEPGDSIVKVISLDIAENHAFIRYAAVLTVLSVELVNGEDYFRPYYNGEDKPFFSVDDLNLTLLPTYAPVGNPPTLEWVESRYQGLQLDDEWGAMGRDIHPLDNVNDDPYGLNVGKDNVEACLRLMLNDQIEDKMPALINYIQYCLDIYGAVLNGQTWPAGGGHVAGRKFPMIFMATLFEDEDMKATLRNFEMLEYDYLYYSNNAGMYLWGVSHGGSTEFDYWNRQVNETGEKAIKDPYEYIDGGAVRYFEDEEGRLDVANYQAHSTSVWKGEVLGIHMMPILKDIWTDPTNPQDNGNNIDWLIPYVDRWVTQGYHMQPDPAAPTDYIWSNYSITYGPDITGGFIRDTDEDGGTGRYPTLHHTNVDGGNYHSAFVAALWNAYRGITPQPTVPQNLTIIQGNN